MPIMIQLKSIQVIVSHDLKVILIKVGYTILETILHQMDFNATLDATGCLQEDLRIFGY